MICLTYYTALYWQYPWDKNVEVEANAETKIFLCGGDDDAKDSDDATKQGSANEGHDEPSEEDDDSDDGDGNPPDSPPLVQ